MCSQIKIVVATWTAVYQTPTRWEMLINEMKFISTESTAPCMESLSTSIVVKANRYYKGLDCFVL